MTSTAHRILVAEDSPTQAERLRLLFEEQGYSVQLVASGHEGLEKVRSGHPHLIISDVVMPGMDGYAFCHAVKSHEGTRKIPFILFTERRGPADIIQGFLQGADNFIPKSSPDDYLLERVRRIFEQLEHRQKGQLSVDILVRVGGRQISVSADKQQMFELLIATLEETGRINDELQEAQRLLRQHAQLLEAKVEDRTRELRESQEQYRLLFDRNPQPMWVYDDDTLAFLAVNDAAVRHYGYSLDEFLAMTVRDIRPPDEVPILEEFAARHKGSRDLDALHSTRVWKHRKKDGSLIDVEIAGSPLEFRGRQAWLTLATDVTDKRRLEAQLLQSQKMESVGRLAGGVAHDFNNLLGVITGYGDLLQRDIGPRHPSFGRVEEIRKAAERAAALTRQLLAFSRKQVLEPRVLDLNAIVSDIEKMLHRIIGEDVQLITVFGESLGRVEADPGQMEQVIVNLAVNARDAMPRGGKLIIETRNVDLDEAYARRRPDARSGPHVMLAISDTGHGMSAETLSHMFEPFFTTKEKGKGTGLGLAMVYGIVRQSGGHVTAYSELGRGTTFKVYLPRFEAQEETVPDAKATGPPPSGTETILLIEDEASLRLMIREILASAGFEVLEGPTPEEGMAAARDHPGPIHMVLTDVVLPRMSGRQVAEALQSSRPEARVLFMSGYTDDAISHHGILDAGVHFLQKPFTTDALLRKVREVLDAGQQPASS